MRLSLIALVLVAMLEEGVLALPTSTPLANSAGRAPNAYRVDRNARLGNAVQAASQGRFAPAASARMGARDRSGASLIDTEHQLDQYLNAAPRRTIAERPGRADADSVRGKAIEVQHASGQGKQRLYSDEGDYGAKPHRVPKLAGLLSDARRSLRSGASGPATEQEKGTRRMTTPLLTSNEKDKGKRKLAEYAGQDAESSVGKKVRAPTTTGRLQDSNKAGTSNEQLFLKQQHGKQELLEKPATSAPKFIAGPSRRSRLYQNVQGLERRPPGKKGIQWDNRKVFDRVWKEHGLNTEIKTRNLGGKSVPNETSRCSLDFGYHYCC